MGSTMMFTEQLWASIAEIYSGILDLPFIRGLTDGTLDEGAFRFYAIQDALYLRDYARGLAILGARAPEDRWLMMFAEHARDSIAVERALHESFFKGWNLTEGDVYRQPLAPNNLMYTSYLLRVAYEKPFHEALGAFLPCYWIYWEVGKALEEKGSPNALFGRWIETYASGSYGTIVGDVLSVMDSLAAELTEEQRSRTRDHFVTTSKLEYLFWDMGYHQQTWPI
jgi:thiaminase/transcriptional activator TenA